MARNGKSGMRYRICWAEDAQKRNARKQYVINIFISIENFLLIPIINGSTRIKTGPINPSKIGLSICDLKLRFQGSST